MIDTSNPSYSNQNDSNLSYDDVLIQVLTIGNVSEENLEKLYFRKLQGVRNCERCNSDMVQVKRSAVLLLSSSSSSSLSSAVSSSLLLSLSSSLPLS